MIRRVTVAAVASIFAIGVAGPATAGGGHSAKPYKASLTAVNPAATTAGLASIRGRARLVDGKKNNKASLHMRNLAAGTMYLWHVHEGTCAATGSPVPGWTFNADPAKRYSVNVHVATPTNGLPAGTIIACGDLSASKAGGKSKPKKPHPEHAKGPKP
jgi:hypothetical protein